MEIDEGKTVTGAMLDVQTEDQEGEQTLVRNLPVRPTEQVAVGRI